MNLHQGNKWADYDESKDVLSIHFTQDVSAILF
jgi:hypothetical protein